MSQESEEKIEMTRREAFKKVDYHVQQIQEILDVEIGRVEQERNAFEEVAKKLEHVHFSTTIKLNVGGQLFTTSLQTLTKDAGSMLNAMFSGRFDTKPAEDGSYFIDRDGTCFRYILNYLRTGKLSLPDDKLIRKDVLEEAMFYQIQGIVDELNREIPEPKPTPKPPEPVYYGDSKILAADQAKWLVSIRSLSKSDLLYRATRDGWGSYVFHSKCDSFYGPTMVVIKSTGGYIFGGYTEQNWSGSGYKTDYSAFLFSIVNPGSGGSSRTQMKAFQYHQNAINCNSGYGPWFGANPDLRIPNNPNSTYCSVNIGNTYSLPSGQSSNFITGNTSFNVAEMEVYGLN